MTTPAAMGTSCTEDILTHFRGENSAEKYETNDGQIPFSFISGSCCHGAPLSFQLKGLNTTKPGLLSVTTLTLPPTGISGSLKECVALDQMSRSKTKM